MMPTAAQNSLMMANYLPLSADPNLLHPTMAFGHRESKSLFHAGKCEHSIKLLCL